MYIYVYNLFALIIRTIACLSPLYSLHFLNAVACRYYYMSIHPELMKADQQMHPIFDDFPVRSACEFCI